VPVVVVVVAREELPELVALEAEETGQQTVLLVGLAWLILGPVVAEEETLVAAQPEREAREVPG
jgi:hypothetical protein